MTSKRKPYTREVNSSWWKKSSFYRFYMLRELTAIPTVWFSFILIYFLYAIVSMLHGGLFDRPAEGGNLPYETFFAFLKHPIVLFLNCVTLLFTLFHTKTWFEVAPKAAILIIKNKKIPEYVFVRLLWSVMLLVSIGILFLVFKPF